MLTELEKIIIVEQLSLRVGLSRRILLNKLNCSWSKSTCNEYYLVWWIGNDGDDCNGSFIRQWTMHAHSSSVQFARINMVLSAKHFRTTTQ